MEGVRKINDMKKYIIYMHISPSNKRYIGLTCQKPERRWRKGKAYEYNEHFTNAINKYGWDNFEHIIIVKGLTKEEAEWLETELIKIWDTNNPLRGYNITKGGEGAKGLYGELNGMYGKGYLISGELNGMYGKGYLISGENSVWYGRHHTEESIEKIRKANIGKTPWNKGKEMSQEYKENVSKRMSGEGNPNYGKKRPEHSEKMSGSNNPSAKKIICLETMEIFDTIKDASKCMNCNYGGLSVAIKKNKKYKGYTFMYYEDYLEKNN